jgi:hypothetical protein
MGAPLATAFVCVHEAPVTRYVTRYLFGACRQPHFVELLVKRRLYHCRQHVDHLHLFAPDTRPLNRKKVHVN